MTDTSTTAPLPESPRIEACKRDQIKTGLAFGALAYLILFTGLVFWRGVPEGAAGAIIDTLAAAAVLQAKDVYGFVFGSSQGSQDKTAQITAALTPSPIQGPTP